MRLEDVIKKPLITEKAARQKEAANSYFFLVDPSANKHLIRQAVEKLFKVKVIDVHTVKVNPKLKRVGKYQGWTVAGKKAIVTLKQGDTIKIFEGA